MPSRSDESRVRAEREILSTWQRVGVGLCVALPVPLFAGSGLAVPLPSIVYRVAVAAIERTEAVAVDLTSFKVQTAQAANEPRSGSIRLTEGEAAAQASGSERRVRAVPRRSHKTPSTRRATVAVPTAAATDAPRADAAVSAVAPASGGDAAPAHEAPVGQPDAARKDVRSDEPATTSPAEAVSPATAPKAEPQVAAAPAAPVAEPTAVPPGTEHAPAPQAGGARGHGGDNGPSSEGKDEEKGKDEDKGKNKDEDDDDEHEDEGNGRGEDDHEDEEDD